MKKKRKKKTKPLKSIQKYKRPQIAQTILNNKKTVGGSTIPGIKLSYRTVTVLRQNRHTDRSRSTADLDICAYNSYMDFDRCQKYTSEKRQNL